MSSLRKKAERALAWDLIGNYGGQLTSFIISILLARLLAPEEFGLIGMSMVFISVLTIFMDFGFASALIQNKINTSITYSSVFYLNVFAGIILTLAIFLAAPLVGEFYGNSQITHLVRILSVTFFISSFNVVQGTILRKSLNFRSLTFRELISQIASGIIAVIFALQGFGVYSLAIQQIFAAVVRTVLLWKSSEWYPRWEFSLAEIKKLAGFSSYLFLAQSTNQLLVQADTLVVGKLFSPSTLGFFSRASSLNSLVAKNSVRSISKVFFPVLSQIQDDDDRFKRVYLRVIELVCLLSFFLTGLLYLTGDLIIIQLFGEKWRPSVFIFKILILQAFTYPISSMIVNALLAKGKSKENLRFSHVRQTVRLIPFIFAYFYGFEAYLFATVGCNLLNWCLNNWFVTLSLGISFWDQMKSVLPYLVFTLFCIGLLGYLPFTVNYLLQGGLFAVAYLIFVSLAKPALVLEMKGRILKTFSKP